MTLPTIKVLLVEDNPADIFLLQTALEKDQFMTFSVVKVERLSHALTLLERQQFDIVLLDLGLPDSQGLATFEQFQSQAPELPVVVFSGNTDEQDAIHAVRSGAQDYLVKTLGGFEMAARAIRHAIDRQKLSKSLQESEKRFSIAFHASPVAQLITVIKTGQILDANQAYCRLMGLERDQLIDRTTTELDLWIDPEDRQKLAGCLQIDGRVSEMEIKFRPRSGEARTLLTSIEPIELKGRQCLISTALDITSRKRAEEKIQASLAEKVVLLREIHHRVKNNLAIVSSLLEMQARRSTDENVRNEFKISQQRILTMAGIHDQLYRSENLAEIDMGEYVSALSNGLLALDILSGVSIQVNIQSVSLDLDRAIPCGLIINELVTNSLKHAYPGGAQAAEGRDEIEISMSAENGACVLSVSDKGAGLPADLDIMNVKTLGLRLVNRLVGQLAGALEVSGAPRGTKFVITFPLPK